MLVADPCAVRAAAPTSSLRSDVVLFKQQLQNMSEAIDR